MQTKLKIRFGLNQAEYTATGYQKWYPLPYGVNLFENLVRVTGTLYKPIQSKRGGYWGWHFPKYVIIGYGKYNPAVLFYFKGKIMVKREKVLNNEGKIYGMRIGEKKVILFDGIILPSELYIIESVVRKYLTEEFIFSVRRFCLSNEVRNFIKQGHLTLYPLTIKKEWVNLGNFLTKKIDSIIKKGEEKGNLDLYDAHRRRIFNHQFFGKARIYWLGKEYWAIRVFKGGEVFITSPDHLLEPIVLSGEKKDVWFIAKHPFPSSYAD
jgi:hypothetical protein